jgi:hypothetical protein
MPRIRCHYDDCVFLEEGFCGAASVEIDPDSGCLTFQRDAVEEADDERESDWEEDDFEDETEDEEELYEDDDEDLWDEDDDDNDRY